MAPIRDSLTKVISKVTSTHSKRKKFLLESAAASERPDGRKRNEKPAKKTRRIESRKEDEIIRDIFTSSRIPSFESHQLYESVSHSYHAALRRVRVTDDDIESKQNALLLSL